MKHDNVFLLLFICVGLTNCYSNPLYYSNYGGKKIKSNQIIKSDSTAIIFSFILRAVAVSRSQALPWIARSFDVDYYRYQKQIEDILVNILQMRLISQKNIFQQRPYLSGIFPIREEFFLNPELLPIIKSKEQEELMLRLAKPLGVNYFITVLIDFQISKIILRPASITSGIELHFYSPTMGYLFSLKSYNSANIFPYDRSLSLDRLNQSYSKEIQQALKLSIQKNISLLRRKAGNQIHAVPQLE